MGAATYQQNSFLGGEWSQSVQGRIDRPDYRTAMNVCLNGIPIDQGAWVRRPGTIDCRNTRGGNPGRIISFDFKEAAPYTMEFTDNHLRFRQGPLLVPTYDPKTVVSQNPNNPVTIAVDFATGFATGDQVYFVRKLVDPPSNVANRLFTITVIDATHYTLVDAITGTTVNGAFVNFVGLAMFRVLDIVTPYSSMLWAQIRSIQAETRAILLTGQIKPQVLTALTPPNPTVTTFGQPIAATFSFGPAVFLDGPYLDPVPGGATLTPSATSGLITATISFPAYDATIAYSIGDFAVDGGINYQSIADQNLNHTPAISPTFWKVVSSGIAVGPNGFIGTDVGRLVRLFSEPPLWNSATAYVATNEVSYPNGVNGAYTYWRALAGSTNVVPGTNAASWAVDANGALWSWGKITALNNLIDPALAGSVNVGDLTDGGGVNAAFDGNTNKTAALSATRYTGNYTNDNYVGKNYTVPGARAVTMATAYPPSDQGFAAAQVYSIISGVFFNIEPQVTLNLRGNAVAPAGPSDGTLLGTSGVLLNNHTPISIVSTDAVTTFNFIWIEIVSIIDIAAPTVLQFHTVSIAQAQFFSPVAGGGANAVTIQILGPKLLYTTAIRVWRLGLYSDTTGYPKNGVYHEGRLWLSGAVDNRIDASKSNGILASGKLDFAPTNPDGSVSDANGISYVFNAPDTNPIFWMATDAQGIICGTQAGEWLVQASNNNNPLSPLNIQAHRWTHNKCANIEPRRTGATLALVQLYKRKLLEFFGDVYTGRLAGQNLAFTAPHLAGRGIEEIAAQDERSPVIWARCTDGSLIGCSYKRENIMSSQPPNFSGWHQHILGSGNKLHSIATGSNFDGTLDALMMVTTDVSTALYKVELLSPLFLETDDPASAQMLDSAIFPSSTTSDIMTPAPYGGMTMSGLWPLNGKTISVYAAGLDCGDFLVANGAITVPYGDGISGGTANGLFTAIFAINAAANSQIVVGFTYTSRGQLVRPALPVESGARSGPALGKTRRTQKYSLLVSKTSGLSIGTVFGKLFQVLFKSPANVALATGKTFTGVYKETLQDDYSYDSMLAWEISRPFPAIISSVGAMLHTQDE